MLPPVQMKQDVEIRYVCKPNVSGCAQRRGRLSCTEVGEAGQLTAKYWTPTGTFQASRMA